MANMSGFNLESLMVPTKAAAVFAAHESSLYLPGGIIPAETVPAGSQSLQVPVIPTGAAAEVDSASSAFGADDFTARALTDATVSVPVELLASRAILRDNGGVNPAMIGEQLGKGVATSFDAKVTAKFADFDTHTAIAGGGTANALLNTDILKAATTLRSAGVMEELVAILHPEQVYNMISDINTTAYAASAKQNEAMQNGFVGKLYGVNIFMSSYITADESGADHLWNGIVMAKDAMRIAMARNLEVEAGRRPEAVGVDIVASLMAGCGVVDKNRGIAVQSTGFTVET